MLTIFDHVFKTYEPEVEAPIYYQEGLSTDNIFKLHLRGLHLLFSGKRQVLGADSPVETKQSDAA